MRQVASEHAIGVLQAVAGGTCRHVQRNQGGTAISRKAWRHQQHLICTAVKWTDKRLQPLQHTLPAHHPAHLLLLVQHSGGICVLEHIDLIGGGQDTLSEILLTQQRIQHRRLACRPQRKGGAAGASGQSAGRNGEAVRGGGVPQSSLYGWHGCCSQLAGWPQLPSVAASLAPLLDSSVVQHPSCPAEQLSDLTAPSTLTHRC
jgi:hypothetical protein